MLSGIKVGKKKKITTVASASNSGNANAEAADALRLSLLMGNDKEPALPTETPTAGKQSYIVIASPDRSRPLSEDANIQEMLVHEKKMPTSLAQQEADSILRAAGQKRKREVAAVDSDEEIERSSRFQPEMDEKRERSRTLAAYDKQNKFTAACWWWMESPSFSRLRLLALGDHVSLVMPPPNKQLLPGKHFYLVPVAHTESLTASDGAVWEEIRRFVNSLRLLFPDQGIVSIETVLPKAQFWHTKLEVLIVPKHIAEDAPLTFQVTLMEHAEEWGTHQKVIKLHTDGNQGRLPKGFPYFYVDFGSQQTPRGYIQVIESTSFPRDLGTDTIAGMMRMDPLRFRKRPSRQENERETIRRFLQAWEPHDWTRQLD